jgi:hypothetical protein
MRSGRGVQRCRQAYGSHRVGSVGYLVDVLVVENGCVRALAGVEAVVQRASPVQVFRKHACEGESVSRKGATATCNR